MAVCRILPPILTGLGSLHGYYNGLRVGKVRPLCANEGLRNNFVMWSGCPGAWRRRAGGRAALQWSACPGRGEDVTAGVPERTVAGASGADAERKRDAARSTLVWDVLRQVAAARVAQAGRPALDIVDVGGGTGGFAVPFAALGHNVTVVDPSPDALAAARRRAAEREVPLAAVQGEADGLDHLVGEAAADLVICHNVLEYVEEPAVAMAAIARVLRPGATVSVLAANAVAAVLQRALVGRYAEARQLLAGGGAGAGVPRRFTLAGLTALIEDAGLRAGEAYGIRVFAGLLPAADPDPGAAEALRALEDTAASYPALRDIAARLHVLGHR
jgi:S-adenosylmethionine-dependent methyltransferase